MSRVARSPARPRAAACLGVTRSIRGVTAAQPTSSKLRLFPEADFEGQESSLSGPSHWVLTREVPGAGSARRSLARRQKRQQVRGDHVGCVASLRGPSPGSRAESQAPDPVVSRLGPLPCVSSGPGPGKLQTRSLRKPWPSVCFSAFLVWRSGGRSPKNSAEASGEEWSYHPVCPRGAPAASPQDSHTLLLGDLCSSSDASSGAQPGAGLWAQPSHPSPPVLLSRFLSPFVLWENFQLRKGPC